MQIKIKREIIRAFEKCVSISNYVNKSKCNHAESDLYPIVTSTLGRLTSVAACYRRITIARQNRKRDVCESITI